MSARLDEVVAHAVAHVPYYRARHAAGARLADLPWLDKPTLRDHAHELVADGFRTEDMVASRSSGTTGEPTTTWRTVRERTLSATTLWQLRRAFGVTSARAPGCRFYGYRRSSGGAGFTMEPVHQGRGFLQFNAFDLSERAMTAYQDALHEHAPVWFQGSPSILRRFADHLLRTGRRPPSSLRLVELIGEMVLPTDRDVIERAFPGVGVANNYGAREVWCIAYECPRGTMHVADDNVHVELVDTAPGGAGGTSGELAVTSLTNRGMPILRYRLGDRVTSGTLDCPCGRQGEVLHEIAGRTVDFAVTLDGEEVYPHFFGVLVALVNRETPGAIRRFQFRQSGTDLAARIEPGPAWGEHTSRRLRQVVALKFPGQRLEVEEGAVAPEQGAKFRPFVVERRETAELSGGHAR